MVNYDLLYITHNNSEEDKSYFNRLSNSATISDYAYLPPERFDLFTHLKLRLRLRPWFCDRGYKNVYAASINSFVINALICRLSFAKLYTFDDGVANLVEDGPYYSDPSTKRMKLYRSHF
jgi:beta-galactosamide-alpha-2,3-sialyltransferase